MRPRKPASINRMVQVNLRIKEGLRRKLETKAQQEGIAFNHLARILLTHGLAAFNIKVDFAIRRKP